MKKSILIFSLFSFLSPAFAQGESLDACAYDNKPCLLEQQEKTIATIETVAWRDKAFRELAKTYAYNGMEDKALALIDKIETPDTRALTIRGIGFAAADSKWGEKNRYDALFSKLAQEAEKIEHVPSHGIALTYIAMAQAFAGDDAGATKTAVSMTDSALKQKALGESAEIQAERGDFQAAMSSIGLIDSSAFRNKSYNTVSKIFLQQGKLKEAYDFALKIDNPYTKSQAIQRILNHGISEEDLTREEEAE